MFNTSVTFDRLTTFSNFKSRKMTQDEPLPRIPEFYKDRCLFVTGFSGFMGKILVEKLIWSCPEIKHIYVLLRGKRNKTPEERANKILNSDLFGRIRERRKEDLKKIVVINGDVTLPNLGLADEQRSELCNEVSIVFHCAASVKFDDPLTFALDINVKGTKRIVDLALNMPNIVAFVQVSTAYSNCDKFDIEEKVYPPHADWAKTLKIRDKMDEGTFNIFSEKYMNHMPNTYVFAKSLGEHIASDYADRLPVVIFRPSIVISTLTEPFPGWIDNLNGPVGLLVGYGTGAVRTCILDSNIMPDFIPVDVAIRGLILSAYTRVYKKEEGIHFYNWCTRDRSVNYKDLIQMGKRLIDDAPMKYVLWRPSTHTTSSKTLFYINFVLFQMIPAFFIDTFLRIVGQKPLLWKIQRKVFIAMSALSYFTLNYFYFHNKNGYDLVKYIPEKDREQFDYVTQTKNVDEYKMFFDSTKYFQLRFFKMKPEDQTIAFIVNKVMTFADRVVKSAFWIGLAYMTYSYDVIPTTLNAIWNFLFNL